MWTAAKYSLPQAVGAFDCTDMKIQAIECSSDEQHVYFHACKYRIFFLYTYGPIFEYKTFKYDSIFMEYKIKTVIYTYFANR